MNDLNDLIFSSHQFFLALVSLSFSIFLLSELKFINYKYSLIDRSYIVLLSCMICLGTFYQYYNEWGQIGFILSLEYSILVTCALIHPKYAVSFLVYVMLSRPWESFENEMMSSMPKDISYLAVISIIGHKIINGNYYFRFNFGTFALLCLSSWLFLSGLLSGNPEESIKQYFEVFIKCFVLFLIIQNSLERSDDILPLKFVFVIAILEKSFVSFYKNYLLEKPSILEEASKRLENIGILSNSNDIAAIFVLAVPFAIYLVLKSNLRPFNWILGIIVLSIMAFLIWESQSRGALLGLFTAFGAFVLIKIKSRKLLFLALAFGVLGTAGSFSLMNRESEDLDGSTENRMIYWKAGLNMALRNPAFGVGFWGFTKNLPSYVDDGNVGSEKEHMTAHSSWILILGEGGFFALLSFLSLWIYAAYSAWKIRFQNPEYLLGLSGYGMCISFLSHAYLLYPYILLSIIITHYQLEKSIIYQRG